MDQIYHGADLTIVAAAGDNANFGLPGVGTTKRKKQQVVELERCTILSTGPDPVYETKQSSWASRGWTFQEASLSRRRLIFTEHQSWFECGQASWMESLGGLEHTTITEQAQVSPMKVLGPSCYRLLLTIPERPSAAVFSPSDPEISTCLDQFFRVVEEYSKRQLAFDNDALNAIAGICGHFQKSRPQVSYLLGIPYVPSPSDAGLEEKYFCYGLSWFHRSGSTSRRRNCFPSWTWAGWAGTVTWMTFRYDGERATRPKARRFHFESREGKPVPAAYYLNEFNPATHPLGGTDATLCFEAQLIPPKLFSCDGPLEIPNRPSSIWSSDDESEDESDDEKEDRR
ncbi:hypothetical protein S7711_10023 [Stachybotrys chartarum IBT 7711]|uniref:Heterokaryon incompatibility domain-containing protein n=1 Tax=Stachybotrys chartarum (strain CBS 109288 / IBT 7711) TaxID=1280523 RepID=A0A084BAC8_STACB|nr:hypothetical protein S7711_10023 [Stachybotrys chartarum IBT 7711]